VKGREEAGGGSLEGVNYRRKGRGKASKLKEPVWLI